MAMMDPSLQGITTIFFDFMGTCLDWHTGVTASFPDRIPLSTRTQLSLAWRESFFADIHSRFEKGLPPEDIDRTHARLLAQLLEHEFGDWSLSEAEQAAAVRSWHAMRAWPDISMTLQHLRAKYEVYVVANGTTRLQVDLARSSNLHFDMLFSSQLLGLTKPDPNFYLRALDLVAARPHETLMVAAHAYDLRAAKDVGFKTVYIQRETEDLSESMDQVKRDVHFFVDGRDGSTSCGLAGVAALLGVELEDKLPV
ncbi:haloacid dehalogenase, type II [Exophiala mesophila]|uniref:Haloacid dehalogenase, type II n=1 Tax=Exophiala mesophila TaxID=212818 RepID=A0A0D1ZSB7_EXOME|nr:haloacid dehalogenase, type II [Exophiala mesophila]KIV96819.1 haloacid dehalogenase, type II [Exophiala mesophila]